MSGASSWLQKQRKSELVDLADSVGFKEYDGLKKAELEVALDDYLRSNSSQFVTDTRLTPFYKRRGDSSPVKKEVPSIVSVAENNVKSVKKRVNKVVEDVSEVLTATTDESEPEGVSTRARNAIARTPGRASTLSFASSVPLPPSPSVVADAIDRRTAVVRRRISQSFEESGALEIAQDTRETLSTVVSVEALIMAFEAYCLRREVLSDRFAFTIPAISLLHTNSYDVKIPDMFLLLTSSFWGPALLWATTSLLVPLLTSYFFNLTSKPRTGKSSNRFEYKFDPLTFNIVKALLTYVVYAQDATFGGWVNLEHVARINSALYGGPMGVLTGCGIGILVTFYEAVLKN